MAAAQEEVDQTRNELLALANQLVDLAKTHEPASTHSGIRPEPEIITKAKALIARAQSPFDHVVYVSTIAMEDPIIRTLLSLNVLQSIPLSGSISLTALADLTGASTGLLERLLRVVVGSSFISQNPVDGSYAHTHLSRDYAESEAVRSLFELLYTEGVELMNRLPQYLAEKGLHEPTSKTHNPFTWNVGEEGTSPFDIIGRDPARLRLFQNVMGSVGALNPYTGFYDFDSIALAPNDPQPERAVFVDVGGGYGLAIARMLAAHPSIRPEQCVLQDLPSTIESARQHSDLPAGIVFQPHDFHTLQPVRHARAYHLRAIAHDLGDDGLVQVLSQIVPVMAPDSKVLIADNIVPDRGSMAFIGMMDMIMLGIGGKERTVRNFEDVLGRAGLQLDGVHRAGGGRTYAMVVASLKTGAA